MAFSRACKKYAKTGKCPHKDCESLFSNPRSIALQDRTVNGHNDVRAWKQAARARCTFHIANEFSEAFFTGARSLVEHDAESMQEVICYMSEEQGLRYIQQLIEKDFETLPNTTRCELFRTQMIPFLEVISNPRVLSSLVVEHYLGVIYNFLYGLGGTRATNLASSICSVLESSVEDDSTRIEWLERSLAVFSQIVFVNSTAFIQTGLGEQMTRFEGIITAIEQDSLARKLIVSRRYLTQLLSRVQAGTKIQTPEDTKQNQIVSSSAPRELPGGRHDNDFEDFASIQIMPTTEEILSPQPEYLPERDPSLWHISGRKGC